MGEFIKSLKNSFDEGNYIKNADRVKMIDASSMEKLCQVKINARPSLEKVFVDEKTRNRRVFIEASSRLFKRKFLGIYLPLIIGCLNILEYASPKSIEVKDLNRYNKTSIVCEDGLVIERSDYNNNYYYDGYDYKFVDGVSQSITYLNDKITFYIMDGANGLKFNLSRTNSDGKISCDSASDGFYSLVSLENKEKLNEELPEEYKELFDDVITYLLDDTSISTKYREMLKNLNDSDKKKIVFEVIEYTKIGTEKVEIYSYHVFRKIILGILAIISASYVFSRFYYGTVKQWDKLIVTEDGLAYDSNEDEDTMYNLFVKYKHSFINAEEKRIEKCVEATRNVENADSLFTKHELEVAKKLVKKYNYLSDL